MGGKKPESMFAALDKLRGQLPPGPPPKPPAPVAPPIVKPPARAVVRYERKGRGGREATVIEKLELSAVELERWCKELKAALGCGGSVDGDAIVLQGDLRRRLEPVLVDRGVRKVTIAG